MSTIIWDPSLETGDPTIDAQHQELFSLVNQLRDASVEGWAEEGVRDVLVRLSDYVATHFAAEQALMARVRYPVDAVMSHTDEHMKLTQRTTEMAKAYARGEVATVLPLAEFLYEWLGTHIRKTDRALIDHARALGEQA